MIACASHKALDPNFIPDCITCLRRNISLFSELGEADLDALNKNKQTLHFKKKEQIFKQGTKPSGLYALSGGKVKNVRISDTGSEQIIEIQRPVEFVGFFDLISDHLHTYSSIALEDCSICYIPIDDFLEVLNGNNAFAVRVLRFVGRQFAQHVERMSDLRGKHMRGRMADALLYIHELFELTDDNNSIQIELKRSDFGDLADMNTANAIRTLSEFTKSGWIDLQKTHISFLDIPALQRVSMTG